jgi:hypothetical protein
VAECFFFFNGTGQFRGSDLGPKIYYPDWVFWGVSLVSPGKFWVSKIYLTLSHDCFLPCIFPVNILAYHSKLVWDSDRAVKWNIRKLINFSALLCLSRCNFGLCLFLLLKMSLVFLFPSLWSFSLCTFLLFFSIPLWLRQPFRSDIRLHEQHPRTQPSSCSSPWEHEILIFDLKYFKPCLSLRTRDRA